MSEKFLYTGTTSLEILKDAVNYNNFLEQELLNFISPEKKALDFGAGIGEFASRLRNKSLNINCVELDERQKRHLEQNNFITFSSIKECSPSSRTYSLNVLEHIEDDISALHELKNNLKSNGKLFLYVPAFMCLYTQFDKNIGHFRRYTLSELKNKLTTTGFTIERAEYVDSVGFLCWFIMGKLPGNKNSINPKMVKTFDKFIFPLSRIIDRFTNKLFGKNLLIIAKT